MSKILIFVVFLVAFANCNSFFSLNSDGKVQVDFYYESLCPYCQQFIQKSLKTAANTKDFWKICDFRLYPYGNAKRTQSGSEWNYTCQHGVRECEGNFIQVCALEKYDFYTQALPFIICLESDTSDWNRSGQKCSTQLNLNWTAIHTCATGSEGNKFQQKYAIATQKLVPAHTYVPWIVVNGGHSSTNENAIVSNMVKFVCSIYTGSERIAACN